MIHEDIGNIITIYINQQSFIAVPDLEGLSAPLQSIFLFKDRIRVLSSNRELTRRRF